MTSGRPPVSVVVPFAGDPDEAERLLGALAGLCLLPDDELIVADNTREAVAVAAVGAARPVRVVRACRERSSYHARNAGAAASRNRWLLFMDGDCVPAGNLLDAYFAEPVPETGGAVGGAIVADPGQRSFLARYSRSRNLLSQTDALIDPGEGQVTTGNVLVRQAAYDSVGGFTEGIRSAGDIDFCRRLCAAGWAIDYRPGARVEHRYRERLVPFLGQIARYGAGSRWLNERYPGSSRPWPLARGLLGAGRDIGRHLVRGQLEPALYRAVDGLGLVAHRAGYLASNDAPRT